MKKLRLLSFSPRENYKHYNRKINYGKGENKMLIGLMYMVGTLIILIMIPSEEELDDVIEISFE